MRTDQSFMKLKFHNNHHVGLHFFLDKSRVVEQKIFSKVDKRTKVLKTKKICMFIIREVSGNSLCNPTP